MDGSSKLSSISRTCPQQVNDTFEKQGHSFKLFKLYPLTAVQGVPTQNPDILLTV